MSLPIRERGSKPAAPPLAVVPVRRSPSGSADRNAPVDRAMPSGGRRSPSGSADRNPKRAGRIPVTASRSPSGSADRNSAPMAGSVSALRRSPSGSADRNLCGVAPVRADVPSLPIRERGSKRRQQIAGVIFRRVAPHPGARIETTRGAGRPRQDGRRSPSGSADRNCRKRISPPRHAASLPIRERGSKHARVAFGPEQWERRSPSGSADRNYNFKFDLARIRKSLPIRERGSKPQR